VEQLRIRPFEAHRVTVFGSTRNSLATSLGVSRRSDVGATADLKPPRGACRAPGEPIIATFVLAMTPLSNGGALFREVRRRAGAPEHDNAVPNPLRRRSARCEAPTDLRWHCLDRWVEARPWRAAQQHSACGRRECHLTAQNRCAVDDRRRTVRPTAGRASASRDR
jgi:hypothetical protein